MSYKVSDLMVSDDDLSKNDWSVNESFNLDFDSFGSSKARTVDPKFKMTLAEFFYESKVVPVSVYGNLESEITGIQHDSRFVVLGRRMKNICF